MQKQGGVWPAHETTKLILIAWHGLGADAKDLYPLAQTLSEDLAANKTLIICPQAPIQPISMHDSACPAWCDIVSLSEEAPKDVSGLESQLAWLTPWIQGIIGDIQAPIVHIGFSQGGAMAATYASHHPCQGLVMLSSYWPSEQHLPTCPILWQHGEEDPILRIDWAQRAIDQLPLSIQFERYPCGHTFHPTQYPSLKAWCRKQLGMADA